MAVGRESTKLSSSRPKSKAMSFEQTGSSNAGSAVDDLIWKPDGGDRQARDQMRMKVSLFLRLRRIWSSSGGQQQSAHTLTCESAYFK